MSKELLKKVVNRVDVRGLLLEDILEDVLFKKLDEFAADSRTPFDDLALNFIKPELRKYLAAELEKYLNELEATG